MNVSWIIEPEVFPENADELIKEIKRQGMVAKTYNYTPLDSSWKSLFHDNDCVIFYGSLQFAKIIHRECRWYPGVWCNLKHFRCTSYYPKLASKMFGRYVFVPLGDLSRQKEFLINSVGDHQKIFVRPNEGDKVFSGQLMHRDTWEQDLRRVMFYDPPASELVVVREPFHIDREYRCVIANGKVIASSQYAPSVSGEVPDVIASYAEQIATLYEPDPVWTVDICVSKGFIYLLEIGSFSCAGLYACNLPSIVKTASEQALKVWEGE